MTGSPEELRVLVADDHDLYRRGLVMALDEADDLEVIAEASDGEEAVDTATALAPDVILMDLRMPGMDGIEACRRITEATPSARIVILTVSDEGDDLVDAVKAGAVGYLLKETSIDDIAESVRRAARGHSFVSPTLADRLLQEFAELARRRSASTAEHPVLSDREISVLEAMAEGHDDVGIAGAVGMSVRGVRNHVRNILAKLELATRTEAVLYAVRSRTIGP